MITIEGGWAWIDNREDAPRLRVLDRDGAHVIATGDVQAIATSGEVLLADGPDRLRAYRRDGGLPWERPGGDTRVVAADARGIACGHTDDDGLWISCYALDGALHWKAGPFPGGYPTLVFWNQLVIASGIYLGEQSAIAILDREDGRVCHLETRGWHGAHSQRWPGSRQRTVRGARGIEIVLRDLDEPVVLVEDAVRLHFDPETVST